MIQTTRLQDIKIEELDYMIQNCDSYTQDWLDVLENPDFSNRTNEVKIFAKPMRTGKNFMVNNFLIRYLFTKHNCKLILMTTPLAGIISQQEEQILDMLSIHNAQFGTVWRYTNEPKQIMQNMAKDIPTIAYATNSLAYTKKSFINFLHETNNTHIPGTIAMVADEMDTWSLSGTKNAKNTLGFSYSDNNYNASMYNLLSIIAPISPHIFGLTGTANAEVSGKIDTVADLKYTLINPLVAGEQKQYAHMVAWLDKVTYFTKQLNMGDLSGLTMKQAWKECMETGLNIEKETLVKRVTFVQSGVEYADKNPENWYTPTPEEFINDFIVPNNSLLECVDTNEIGVVLTSNDVYTFNKYGKRIESGLSQDDVYDKINDSTNLVRYFIVKNMAGRGMTFPLLGEIFIARFINRKDSKGYPVTESTQQIFGRGKSVNIGPEQEVFWTNYNGDVREVPMFLKNSDVNTYNLWLPDTPMYKRAVDIHRKYDACTKEMLVEFKPTDICPTCLRPYDESIEELESHAKEGPCYVSTEDIVTPASVI